MCVDVQSVVWSLFMEMFYADFHTYNVNNDDVKGVTVCRLLFLRKRNQSETVI